MQTLNINEHCCRVGYRGLPQKKQVFSVAQGEGPYPLTPPLDPPLPGEQLEKELVSSCSLQVVLILALQIHVQIA